MDVVVDCAVAEGSGGRWLTFLALCEARPEVAGLFDEELAGYEDAVARRDRARRKLTGGDAVVDLVAVAVEVEKAAVVADVWRQALRGKVRMLVTLAK